MKGLLKLLLTVILIIIVIIIGFRIHPLLGFGLILLAIGFIVYYSRPSLYTLLGSAKFAKDEIEQALAWYKKAYSCMTCPEKHKIGYAYLLMRTGDPIEAENILQQIQQSSKNRETRLHAQCNLATTYWLQGKKDQALALLEEVFEQYKNTLVYGNLGYFKILQGNVNEALEFNLEAYAYNSDDKTILDNLAVNYYLLGQVDQAEEMFHKLMLKSPKHAEPYYYYALTLQQQGKTEAAIEQINLALGKDLAFVTPITREQMEQTALDWKTEH